MAQACLDFKYCDEVWLLPSPDRWDKRPKASAEHRLAMLRIACMDFKLPISIRDSEILAGEYRGTLHMLRRLRADHPKHEFLLLLGADSVQNIPQWRDPFEYDGTNPNGVQLLREFSLIVYPRKGFAQPSLEEFKRSGYKRPYTFSNEKQSLDVPEGISASSVLRPRIWKEPAYRNELPLGVWDYIRNHDLYK